MAKRNSLIRAGLALPAMLLLTGCADPKAEFTVGETHYKPGDTIHLQNTSTGSEAFEWYLDEKPVGSAANLSYVVGEHETGVLTFKLKASDGDKASVSTHTVLVQPITGTVTVWSSFPGVQVMRVEDEKTTEEGTTSAGHATEPMCNADGCVNLKLAPGSYTIDGISAVTRTRRIVDVTAGECVAVKMH